MRSFKRFVSALVFGGLFLFVVRPLAATTYYVSTSGNDTNSGTTTAAPWRTINKATTTVTAGSTVYIKAGLYQETAGVWCSNSGTAANPITYGGYVTTPGDYISCSYDPAGSNTLNPAELPVLQGSGNYSTVNWGFSCWGASYIRIRNIGVTQFAYAMFPRYGSYWTLSNVYVVTNGVNGFHLEDCNHCTLSYCVATDTNMNNIFLSRTSDSTVTFCKSYSVAYSPRVTNYHIVLADSQNNTVSHCTAENLHSSVTSSHAGHGIGIKDTASGGTYPYTHSYGNSIYDVVVRNCGEYFFVAHLAYSNNFRNYRAYGNYTSQAYWSEGLVIRDGAYNNSFGGGGECRILGVRNALNFEDTVEGPTTAQICTGNYVGNTVFADYDEGIQIWNADNNSIINCVFNNSGGAFIRFTYDAQRVNTGNTIRNTIVTNASGGYQSGTNSTVGVTYSDFYSNGFTMPAGTGNLALDPRYVDSANKNFYLKSTAGHFDQATSSWITDAVSSPCIDTAHPWDSYTTEPSPNGSRRNMGTEGGGCWASKTP